MKRFFVSLYLFIILYSSQAQNLLNKVDPEAMKQWVDSVMTVLTPEQRLGQLIMPQVVGGNNAQVRSQIKTQLQKYHIGGIFFSKGTIASQDGLTRHAQALASDSSDYCAGIPLLVGIDGEWGLAMRLSDAPKFPRNSALSNINSNIRDTLCYLYGQEVARECRLLGIHINFAPVLDVNSNPKNPVIGTRSFGSTVESVEVPAIAYARGLESGGVLSTGKHFPGHGDTDTDSHLALPRLSHSKELMFERELKPFESFVKAGLGGLMVAHLDVPSLSEKSGMPSTASKDIVTGILRETFGFEGLIITDGLAMKGAANYPDICTKALLAGNDILLQPFPIERQWKEILAARERGELTQEIIDEKCRRVLAWKYALIIANPVPSLRDNTPIDKQINTAEALSLVEKLNKLSQDSTATLPELDPTQQTDRLLDAPLPFIEDAPLSAIDTIVNEGLLSGAYPGCQVLVAQHGKILYHKSFGFLDFSGKEPVSLSTRYDLASVTKASATLPALMLAIDKYGIRLSDKLSRYIPELKGTDKENLTVQQALFHETGMKSAYNFYTLTLDSTSIDDKLYSTRKVEPYTIQQDKNTWFHKGLKFKPYWISKEQDDAHTLTVADGMFVRGEMRDSILSKIISLPLKNVGRYRYSDLNFVLLRLLIEKTSGKSIDAFLYSEMPELYNNDLCYQPLKHGIDIKEIAPTEEDQALRHQLLRGYVHDELAAWSGGVEGNAGLFGSAQSLYPVLQMMLDNGRIGDKQLISESTCRLFTTKKSKVSRRGLGFDKPESDPKKTNPCYDNADTSIYGHTGYTGTCFWIDPRNETVFIFLCNRVNPHRWNTVLMKDSIRSRIQEAIYQALK